LPVLRGQRRAKGLPINAGAGGRSKRAAVCRPGYFSVRQLIDPRVSIVEDSTSAVKPLRIRYLRVTTVPLPIIDTP
jgi:hypothetical protein